MNDLASIIAQLEQQRTAIDHAVEALRGIGGEQPQKRPGRPPGAVKKATRKGGLTPQGRKALADNMRRMWAAKRAGK